LTAFGRNRTLQGWISRACSARRKPQPSASSPAGYASCSGPTSKPCISSGRARGEGHEQSDLDIALIVARGARARRYDVYDLAFDVGLDHSVDLAPLVLEEEQFNELKRRERLIAQNIQREGIAL